jgi:hypothetical protein
MSTLSLRILPNCYELYVEFYVDAENLGTRVKTSLGQFGFDNVLPWYGGDYSISETVLGESARTKGADEAILFACGCGQYACSAVFARVKSSDESIMFSEFFTYARGDRVLAAIEPVTFDRKQFDDAILQLEEDIKVWSPMKPRASSAPPHSSS